MQPHSLNHRPSTDEKPRNSMRPSRSCDSIASSACADRDTDIAAVQPVHSSSIVRGTALHQVLSAMAIDAQMPHTVAPLTFSTPLSPLSPTPGQITEDSDCTALHHRTLSEGILSDSPAPADVATPSGLLSVVDIGAAEDEDDVEDSCSSSTASVERSGNEVDVSEP